MSSSDDPPRLQQHCRGNVYRMEQEMTDLPERVWIDFNPRDWPTERIMYGEMPEPYCGYLRADTVVTKAEADTMVAAAVKQARYIAHIAWGWPESEASSMPVCEAISEIAPADARAAFEQAVREAVEAERAKWQSAITLIERVYYMEGKDAKWRAAHMNGIARDVQNGLDLAWARRMFPRDSEALSDARKVHAEEAAAIRAPQETSE